MLVSGFWFLTGHLGSLGSSIKQLTTWQLDSQEGEKEVGRGRAGEGKRRCPRWQGLSNASHPPARCCYQVCSLAAEIRQEVGSLGAMRVYFSGLHGKDGVYPEQRRGKVITLLRRV